MSDTDNKLELLVVPQDGDDSQAVALNLLRDIAQMVQENTCGSFAIEWTGTEVTFQIGTRADTTRA